MGPTAIEPLHVPKTAIPVMPRDGEPSADHAPVEGARPALRLQLTGERNGQRGMLDGVWCPHSRDLLEELPPLIVELGRQRGQINRVSYYPETWDPAPRTVAVAGHTIKLGWFHSMDPHLLMLTGVYGAGRLDLLVIPHDSSAAAADSLMAAANDPSNRKTASAVLLEAVDADPGAVGNLSPAKGEPLVSPNHDLSPV
jgi:hypothetical protein